MLKEYVPPFKPALVLWFYFEVNDLLDLRLERQSALFMRYLAGDVRQELRQRQPEVDRVLAAFMDKEAALEEGMRQPRLRGKRGVLGQTLHFAQLPRLRARLGLLRGRSQKENDLARELNDLALFRQILADAKTTVGTWGGTLDFVYLPDAARFLPRYAFDRSLDARHHDQVRKAVADLGIPFIDVLPAFEAHRDPLSLFPFRGPGHYAEAGHRLVADEVLKEIARSGVLRARGVIADSYPPKADPGAWGRPHAKAAPAGDPRPNEARKVG